MKKQWVLASSNPGKIREIQSILSPYAIECVPQSSLGVTDIEETGLTFVENALIKARHATRATGLPAIADDSGLVVRALDGAPGIYSARYAGVDASDEACIDKLLQALHTVAQNQRLAHYYCAIVVLQHADDPSPWICEGSWSGEITQQRRGHLGFGYDPIFQIGGRSETAAELELSEKNKISHRGLALTKLLKHLQQT